MGITKHLLNGIISLVISIVATAFMESGDDGSYYKKDLILAVSVSAFLSGLFTSYFASK